jgi:hypothetical protein
MQNIIKNGVTQLKQMYFCDIYNLISGNTFENLIDNHNDYQLNFQNIEIGTEYKIFRTLNKQIFCINKKSEFFDLKLIWLHYLKYMRISFKSFDNSLNDNEMCSSVIIGQTNEINDIINNIINYVLPTTDSNKIFLKKYILSSDINNLNYDKVFNFINFKINISDDFESKLILITNFFNYVYNNFNIIQMKHIKFVKLEDLIIKIINQIRHYIMNKNNIHSNNLINTIDATFRLFECMNMCDYTFSNINNLFPFSFSSDTKNETVVY